MFVEKWGKNREKGGSFAGILTDLSKAFDCLLQDLLIAKLYAYGFDMASLKLIFIYLYWGKFMRGNFIWCFSSFHSGVASFIIFICNIFLFTDDTDSNNYTDGNTPYVTSSKTNLVIEKLEECSDSLFTWF